MNKNNDDHDPSEQSVDVATFLGKEPQHIWIKKTGECKICGATQGFEGSCKFSKAEIIKISHQVKNTSRA